MPTITEQKIIQMLRIIGNNDKAEFFFEEPIDPFPTLFIKSLGMKIYVGSLELRVYHYELRDEDEDEALPDKDTQVVEAFYKGDCIFRAEAPWPEYLSTNEWKSPLLPRLENYIVRITPEPSPGVLCLLAASLSIFGQPKTATR